MTMIVIRAYLRRPGGALKRGSAAVEFVDRYNLGRAKWWLHGTIVELGAPRYTEIVGQNELDDGPAMELAPLVIPAVEILRMSQIEHPERQP